MKQSARRTLGVLVAGLVLGSCSTAGAPATSSASLSPASSSTAVPETSTVPTSAVTDTSPDTTAAHEPLPRNAQEYASVAFGAWTEGDEELLVRLLTTEARHALADASLDAAADWGFDRCEGAAGSTYCTWTGPDGTLTFRVANQDAGEGEEHAITETLVAGG